MKLPLLAVLLVACAHPSPPPAPPADETAERVALALRNLEAVPAGLQRSAALSRRLLEQLGVPLDAGEDAAEPAVVDETAKAKRGAP